VLLNWAYNYVTWDRGPRLILDTWAEAGQDGGLRSEDGNS